MTENFFDPIQQTALVGHLRSELNILQTQIALLREIQSRTGAPVDFTETLRLAAVLEAKICALEARYTTIH
jgi:hypothetical protein